MVKILNWNLNSIKQKLPELQQLIALKCPDVITLQETKLKSLEPFSLTNFITCRKDIPSNQNAREGVLIAIRNTNYSKQIPLQTNFQAVAATVVISNTNLTICSLYLHQTDTVTEHELSSLVHQLPKPYILCGDFNRHHLLWGSRHTDSRDQEIEAFLLINDVTILNTNQPTRYNCYIGSQTCIDLCICSSDIPLKPNWSIFSSLLGSDHYPHTVTINFSPSKPSRQNVYPRWNLKKADWPMFQQKAMLDIEINSVHLHLSVYHQCGYGNNPSTHNLGLAKKCHLVDK